jgi:kynurenine formamidase
MRKIRRHAAAGAAVLVAAVLGLVAGLILGSGPGADAAAGLRAAGGGVAAGYAAVDPRDPAAAQQVFLGQPLSGNAPIFPGDPPFRWQLWNCVSAHPSVPRCAQGSGYTLEQIQSLGTHTGTHISAPCHFHDGAPCLDQLPEKFFGLRPLVVINVKPLIQARNGNGDLFITASYIQDWLKTGGCGAIPRDSYVVLDTGLSGFYHLGNQRVPGLYNDYYDDVPGFDAASTRWLWQHGAPGSARTPSAPTPPWTRTSVPPARSPAWAASPWRTWARAWPGCGPAATGSRSTARG